MVKRKNGSSYEEYLGPIKFIVAIVGPQQQDLSRLIKYTQTEGLKNSHINSKSDINLVRKDKLQ